MDIVTEFSRVCCTAAGLSIGASLLPLDHLQSFTRDFGASIRVIFIASFAQYINAVVDLQHGVYISTFVDLNNTANMEYMGQTQTATYMTGPKLSSSTTSQFLPAIGSMQSSYKAFDTYPAPSPLRRSHTTLPWRPSTYYGVAKVNPTVSHLHIQINY